VSTAISGRDLLTLVKENPDAGHQELAAMAGYIRINRKGEEVISVDAFKDALLDAKGISIKPEVRGRAAANETTVHAGGGILIGCIYAKLANVGPGDVYSITVNPETSQIVLDLTERAEGSPRPFKVYDRAQKAKTEAAASMQPVAA
jgi:hypothetical protein